ncbi:MAG: hypothetical protein K6A41_05795 [Bacteroidales bacterium]|nr:hypothetical protein [Bacteroidales bacterium]
MTAPEHRGNGYYPYLLTYILNEVKRKDRYDFYMIINEINASSIKGVEKAGFVLWGSGQKENRRYVLLSERK